MHQFRGILHEKIGDFIRKSHTAVQSCKTFLPVYRSSCNSETHDQPIHQLAHRHECSTKYSRSLNCPLREVYSRTTSTKRTWLSVEYKPPNLHEKVINNITCPQLMKSCICRNYRINCIRVQRSQPTIFLLSPMIYPFNQASQLGHLRFLPHKPISTHSKFQPHTSPFPHPVSLINLCCWSELRYTLGNKFARLSSPNQLSSHNFVLEPSPTFHTHFFKPFVLTLLTKNSMHDQCVFKNICQEKLTSLMNLTIEYPKYSYITWKQ